MNNINICLWNWADYNSGIDNWKWFALPEDTEDMYEWIENMNNDGKEEIFICDSYHSFIGEHTNIEALVELSICDFNEIMELTAREPVYNMCEFDDIMSEYTPTEVADKTNMGEYNPAHSYFTFDGNMNIETLSAAKYEDHQEKAFNEGAKEFLRNY